MNTTIHARCIVNDDTTHHRTSYRCRIRRKHATVWFQDLIDPGTHDTWLQTDGILVFANLILFPMLACNNEHRVSTTLSRERGACCTERKGQFVLLASFDNFRDFLFAITANDDLRNLAVKTGICTPAQGTELIGIDTVRR